MALFGNALRSLLSTLSLRLGRFLRASDCPQLSRRVRDNYSRQSRQFKSEAHPLSSHSKATVHSIDPQTLRL